MKLKKANKQNNHLFIYCLLTISIILMIVLYYPKIYYYIKTYYIKLFYPNATKVSIDNKILDLNYSLDKLIATLETRDAIEMEIDLFNTIGEERLNQIIDALLNKNIDNDGDDEETLKMEELYINILNRETDLNKQMEFDFNNTYKNKINIIGNEINILKKEIVLIYDNNSKSLKSYKNYIDEFTIIEKNKMKKYNEIKLEKQREHRELINKLKEDIDSVKQYYENRYKGNSKWFNNRE